MADDFAAHLRRAEEHLAAAPGRLGEVIAAVGPCTLRPDPDVFRVLVRAMIAQLISTAAAKAITGRLERAVRGRVTPAAVGKLTDDQFAACGIGGGKRKAIRGAADHFRADRRFAARVRNADDDTARRLLLPLHGVGPWTVDMVLMFGLGRLDVLPVGDLGLRAGARDLFGAADLPSAADLTRLAEPWRPYRTVATWYVWRGRGWIGAWT